MTPRTPRVRIVAVLSLVVLLVALVVGAAAAAVAPPGAQASALSETYLFAVNAGGSAYTDQRGVIWAADQPYAPAGWGYVVGTPYSTTARIEQTDDQLLYQSERWNMDAYRFDLANGTYDVELHFAEIYPWICPTTRSFDVLVEGETVLDDLDIFATVGAYMPLVRAFTTTVADGRLDIEFPHVTPPGKVSALLVRLHAGGDATPTYTPTTTRTATGTRTPTSTGTRPPGGWPTATPPAVYEVRLNAGDGSYTDIKGLHWSADQAYAPGSWGYVGGDPFFYNHDIAGADDPLLYQSSRWGMSEYRFDLPNGLYRVDLKFAEVYTLGCPGARVFDVSINTSTVITGLDLMDHPGRYTARDFSFTTEITSGQLSVAFSSTVGVPIVSAIRVESFLRGPTPTPSLTPTVTNTPTPTQTPVPPYDLRVNAGGALWPDPYGNTWEADKPYSPGSWGFSGGAVYATNQPIAGTDLDKIYQSERFWGGGGSYTFDVPNGDYRVELRFAELYYNRAGARRFDVLIEGTPVLANLDLFASAPSRYTAYDRTFDVTVSDGQLNLGFVARLDAPKLNALRVTRLGVASPTVTPSRTGTPLPPTATATASATAPTTATTTATSAASPTTTASATPMPPPIFDLRVNAGGGAYTDTLSAVWQADRAYTPGVWGAVGGLTYSVPSAIANTNDDVLYQSEHWGMSSYMFDVPNGDYLVELRLAEIYESAANRRVFDITIEGAVAAGRLDVFAAAGGKFVAYDRTFLASVADGQLNIGFVSIVGSPKVSALHVTLLAPATPTATPTAVNSATPTATLTPAYTNTATATALPSSLSLTSVADTALYVVYPNTNYGASATSYCGGYGYQDRDNGLPCLFLFDVSAIPSHAIITSAQFRAYATQQNGAGTLTFSVFALLRPWTEMGATWNASNGASLWNTAGAEGVGSDREGLPSALGQNLGAPPANWATIDVTDLVQRWVSRTLPNHGMKLQKTFGSATSILLNIREAAGNPPQLLISWIPGPTATPSSTPTNSPTPTPTATATSTATATATATAITSPTPIYDVRVNVAGGAYTDGTGQVWAADKPYAAASWGHVSGLAHVVSSPIANTEDDALYQTERYWPSGGAYAFDVANGTYRIELKFAELYYNAPNYRRFGVTIEGTAALSNFDVWLAAGGRYIAVDRVFVAEVADGQLNIAFTVGSDAPIVNALRVTKQ